MLQLLAIATAAALTNSLAAPPKNGEELIRDMYQRYAGKWYRTLTFVQKTGFPDGRVETWYEAAQIPGFLRIDIAPLDSGRAILFRNDSIYQVRGGKVGPGNPFIHPLLVLGFDVYLDPGEKTVEKLKALGFDLSKLRADTWQGKPVYVVGADQGDEKSPQFWVEQERLLFVRLLRPTAQGALSEVQFNKYAKAGNTWIAPEVLFFVDGKAGQTEEYSDIRTGMTFDANLFDPAKWGRAGWVR